MTDDNLDTPNAPDTHDDIAETFSKIIRDYRIAMNEFNDGMKRREHLNAQAEQRSVLMHRLGMFSAFLLFLLVVFLIYTLQANTRVMATQVDTMNHNMLAVANHVDNVQQIMHELGTNVHSINNHLQNMPEFSQLATTLQQDLTSMQMAMTNINDALGQVNSAVLTAQTDMETMNENLSDLRETTNSHPAYPYYRY